MPTYTVKYSNINLSQKQKNSIANDITNTHSKYTGANTFFSQVIFHKNQKNMNSIILGIMIIIFIIKMILKKS